MTKFINWDDIPFKKSTGKEKVRCPECDGQRSDKKDRSLHVTHSEGKGFCHYCNAVAIRDDEPVNSYTKIDTYEPLADDLSDSKELAYINSRGISEETIKSLYVTFEDYYQPSLQKSVSNIVFNYYEGSKLVNKKYRSAGKKFTQISGAKPIFYNINSVIGQDVVYIVEGEMDVLAMVEAGYRNTISVPNGGNDNDNYWVNSEKYLKDVKQFIIAVDNDTVGNELRDKIAQRLGRYRCKYIEFNGKDANDDLISGHLKESIDSPITFPISGTYTAKDLRSGVNDLYDNGLPDTLSPKGNYFGDLKRIFSVMRGQVVLPTGIPSHGKSTFTDWYVMNILNDYNLKGSWYSPEHGHLNLYQTEFIQKAIGRNFWKDKDGVPRVTKADIDRYDDWADEKIYLTDADDDVTPNWDWLLDKFKEQMMCYGIDIFVVDAFNKIELAKGNKLDEINRVLTKLTHFAKANNVIIFLVAHPTKMKKREDGTYDIPTLYDVSGSADFRNQVHAGYSIYRYFGEDERTTFINLKTKFSFQGKIGESVDLKYCHTNGRLLVPNYPNPHFDLTKKDAPEIKQGELLDAFGGVEYVRKDENGRYIDDDEVPF